MILVFKATSELLYLSASIGLLHCEASDVRCVLDGSDFKGGQLSAGVISTRTLAGALVDLNVDPPWRWEITTECF